MKRYEKIARNTILGGSLAVAGGAALTLILVAKIVVEVGIF